MLRRPPLQPPGRALGVAGVRQLRHRRRARAALQQHAAAAGGVSGQPGGVRGGDAREWLVGAAKAHGVGADWVLRRFYRRVRTHRDGRRVWGAVGGEHGGGRAGSVGRERWFLHVPRGGATRTCHAHDGSDQCGGAGVGVTEREDATRLVFGIGRRGRRG